MYPILIRVCRSRDRLLARHGQKHRRPTGKSEKLLRCSEQNIPSNSWTGMSVRRKLFYASSLPNFSWLFCIWFYLSAKQREKIEHVYMSDVRIVYASCGHEDLTSLALSRERSLERLCVQILKQIPENILMNPLKVVSYRQTWTAFPIATSPNKDDHHSCIVPSNSIFANRLHQRAHHTYLDFLSFSNVKEAMDTTN
jgi:hypothetical protein